MLPMKEQDRTQEKYLHETETGNLPDKEFKVKVTEQLADLRRRTDGERKHERVPNRSHRVKNTKMNWKKKVHKGLQQQS